MPEMMFTIKEVTEILGIPQSTVYSWVRKGKIPSTYDRGRKCYMIRKGDLKSLNVQSAPAAGKEVRPGKQKPGAGKRSWTIPEVIKITGFSRSELHSYHMSGLISPSRNSVNGRRFYLIGESDMQKLMKLKDMAMADLRTQVGDYEREIGTLRKRISDYERAARQAGKASAGMDDRRVRPRKGEYLERVGRLLGALRKYAGYSGLSAHLIDLFDNTGDAGFAETVLGDRPSGRELRNMEYVAEASETATPEQMTRFMEIYKGLDSSGRAHVAHEFYRSGDKEAVLRGEITAGKNERSEYVKVGEKTYIRHTFHDAEGPGIYWTDTDYIELPVEDMIYLERQNSSKLPSDIAAKRIAHVRAYSG